ncbi:transcriptional antiterminator, BglG family [Selenomonas ruminantium]|uniref:Transcriptional antiterminator, BglG family n=1 Tax=Selenomonas ruminantium TaxID=971 RepID=A0A1M6R1P9_SELRU|nr:BglG family transcription antiterminator [Selenomonas ruminantium]SHK26353.1 transcriptional antiterminator, BglG family [Selenomonas ruminantium]
MNLRERTTAILKMLTEGKSGGQSAAELAEKLGVSTKTVSRELPAVAEALKSYGLNLNKKKGTGYHIDGGAEAKASLKEFLGQVNDRTFSPEERRSIIVSQLLPNQEPVKLFALASLLGVTDGTISNDLDKLEGWFKGHGLKLVRKPGLGVYIEGREQDIRQAIVTYIYEHVGEAQLLQLVQANLTEDEQAADKASSYLLELVDKEIIQRLERLIRQTEKGLKEKLSDQAFVGLLVHLALAVQRIRRHEPINLALEVLQELQQKREFALARELGKRIAQEFAIEINTAETGYIAMHILGARSRYQPQGMPASLDNFHLVRMAKAIMGAAERLSGQKLYRNSALLTGLVNHLGPSISRLKMGMPIRNPLLGEMNQEYPELMQLAAGSVKEIEQELEVVFPEEEIAYIAMHLGAALNDTQTLKKLERRVIVACPTGMGTSRLLASRLRQMYDNLIVHDMVSTLQLTPEYFASHEADFIIATVPVRHMPLPVVVVSALLSPDDQEKIDALLDASGEKVVESQPQAVRKLPFVEALRIMTAYEQSILTLLDGFFFVEDAESMTVQGVARLAGRQISGDKAVAASITRDLLAREDKGSTAVSGNHMILLHCRSQQVKSIHFGIVHMGEFFFYPAEPTERIRTAAVMVAPKECSAYELETIGYISAILLERWGFIEVLHEGNKRLIHEELVRIFQEFHAKKYKELMEG